MQFDRNTIAILIIMPNLYLRNTGILSLSQPLIPQLAT